MNFSIPFLTYAINEKILGRKTLSCYKELENVQQYSEDEINRFQLDRLKALLSHAGNYTKYYKGFDDFKKMPLLTKENIKGNLDKFISKDKKRKLTLCSTSGSTGHPLIFYLSNERIAANKAAYLMIYNWWGLKIGDREAALWSSSRDLAAYHFAKIVRDRLLNTRLLPAFQMSEATLYKYAEFLQSYKPKDVFGYAHSIYILARFAKNRNIRLDELGLKVVFTTAEVLHDYQRQLIQEVFSCPVCDCYGGRESGLVAFECPKGNMHLNPMIYTEFINNEIVITDLYSYGFPFIRYRTGDQGILSDKKSCSCGVNFPIVKKIVGRDTDYIVGPNGEFIHPLALEYVFKELEGVDYFRIVQKNKTELTVDLAVNQKFDKKLEPVIKEKLSQAMGGPVNTFLNYIKENQIPAQNKHKFVVSEIINKYK